MSGCPAAARELFTALDAKGVGYAISREDELKTVRVRQQAAAKEWICYVSARL